MADQATKEQQAAARKLADKYETAEELEKAYKELEAKLGEQGQKLGDLSKQAEEAEQVKQSYNQLYQWAQQVNPAVQWMQQHQNDLSQWWQQRQSGQQPSQQASSSYDQYSQSLLTSEERQALIREAQQSMLEQYIKPWQQQLDQRLGEVANTKQKEITDYVSNQQRANSTLWWDALQNVLPEESVKKLQARHAKAMEFAEPNKINPLQLADQLMSHEEKIQQYEQQVEEMKKERDAERQRAAGLLNGSASSLGTFSKPDKAPATKKDRYQAVVDDVMGQYGTAGLESLFHKG